MLSWGLGREVFIRNKQTPMKGSRRKQGWAAGEIGLRWKPHRPRPAWQEALEQTDAAPQRPPLQLACSVLVRRWVQVALGDTTPAKPALCSRGRPRRD